MGWAPAGCRRAVAGGLASPSFLQHWHLRRPASHLKPLAELAADWPLLDRLLDQALTLGPQ
jgi:hypothetical protein